MPRWARRCSSATRACSNPPSLDGKAAALLASLVRDHGLVDGNRRLGWVAVRLFSVLDDRELRAPEDEAFALVMAVADGSIRDVADIAAVLVLWAD